MAVAAIVGIIVGVVVAAATVAFTILTAQTPPEQQTDFSPGTIDDVQGTRTNEGIIVPLVYGRVRIPGNVIWYGNLIYEQTFLIGDTVSQTGFRYFLDLWQGVCLGKAELLAVYVDNVKVGDLGVQEPIWTYLLSQWNNGYDATQPTQFFGDGPQPPEYVNTIPGVAHQYWNAYLLGENKLVVPTIHFVVERELFTPVDFQNMATGSNPAAVIYDLLVKAKIPDSKIDLPSFNVAAAFWNDKEYGINFSINSMSNIESISKKVLGLFDASMSENTQGKIILKVRDPAAPPAEIMSDDDYMDFKIKRITYEQVPNDFKAKFRDEEQDYTTREIGDQNQAVIYLNENIVTESIDMTMFRNVSQASRRLTEIKKNLSYPALEIEVDTHLGFSELLPGDKVRLSNSRLGIVSADFWVTEITKKELDKNEFSFKARQATESLFDDVFQILGGSENIPPDYSLQEFDNVRVLELPYTSIYGFESAYAYLVNREVGIETGFLVQVSETFPSGYVDKQLSTLFSASGFLAEAYPLDTHIIDETQGVLYTPQFRDPPFSNLTTNSWLTSTRYAIIGNEILFFRTIANEGNDIRLSGIIRGRLNTPQEAHPTSSPIFLFYFGNNVVEGITFSSFYSKPVAQFNAQQFDPSLVTPLLTSKTGIAKRPLKPGFVKATRTGGNIDVEIFPRTPDIAGFGERNPTTTLSYSGHPYPFIGEILVKYDATTVTLSSATTTSFARVGAFTLTIEHKRFGLLSEQYIISVGSTDGEYL